MRPPEILLILLSVVIIVLAGFGPLFGSRNRPDMVPQECELFYGPSGPDAVTHCITEMAQHSAGLAR